MHLPEILDITQSPPTINPPSHIETKKLNKLIKQQLSFPGKTGDNKSIKTLNYMAFQIQVMKLLNNFFKPTDPFITELFSAPLSILNQKKLFNLDNHLILCRGLLSLKHYLSTSNVNSFLNSDWFCEFSIQNFKLPDIYEKHVREFICEGNITNYGKPISQEELDQHVVAPAIDLYKLHRYGTDARVYYKGVPIIIAKENIPNFSYIKQVHIYGALHRHDKLKELITQPICGLSYQNITSALLNPEDTTEDLSKLCDELKTLTTDWLTNNPPSDIEILHALEQLASLLIYHKLGKESSEEGAYITSDHFSSLGPNILINISNSSHLNKAGSLIDFIIEKYEKTEEIITQPTKDRQQFYSIILAFSIANQDLGLFFHCANKMKEFSKTSIDTVDINLSILKRIFDYYDVKDINYLKNYIIALTNEIIITEQQSPEPLLSDDFRDLLNTKRKVQRITDNWPILNKVKSFFTKKIKDTSQDIEPPAVLSPERLDITKEISTEPEIPAINYQKIDSENLKTLDRPNISLEPKEKKETQKTTPKKKDVIQEKYTSSLPMLFNLDSSTNDETLSFIQDRVTSFPNCKNLPLLLCESTDLTDNQKWEILYTKCNIKYSYIPIDTTTIVHGTKYEVIFNLKLITEKLDIASPILSYKNYKIYELKQGADYRLFLAKDKTDNITLVHSCEGSQIAHSTHDYKETIKGILDSPNPPKALFLA